MNRIDYDNEIRRILLEHKFTAGRILNSKNKKYLYDYIMQTTDSLTSNISITVRAMLAIEHINSDLQCVQCGKPLSQINITNRNAENFRDRFTRFCSPTCECLNDETKKKTIKTNLKNYGCEWSFQSDNNKSKARTTSNEKYGVDYAIQNESIKEKQRLTMFERYGAATISQTADGKTKQKTGMRRTMYGKFLDNQFVKPIFSEQEYIQYGDSSQYQWKCMKCGNVFTAFRSESWFKQGQVPAYARCPTCYPDLNGTSYSEHDVFKYLKSLEALKPGVEIVSRTNENRKLIPPYELDILIKKDGVVKYAVEYDGLYWHSDGKCPKNYHLTKTEMCERIGIRLIHIFENDWLNKRTIVESRLNNLMGIYDKTVFARRCVVAEIEKQRTDELLNTWHIQGSCQSSVNIALKDENDGSEVCVMTFGKSRFSKKHEWELLRFCSAKGVHIPGGASKLLKYFERTYNPKSIISYADRRWSNGNVYEKLGFDFVRNSPPNYWYWKNPEKDVKSRIEFQKHKLSKMLKTFDPSKTEYENMTANGYYRIFDCGNMVFEKIYKK